MYSKIPTPKSDWTKENMEYAMCFFPFVGLAIGGTFYGWWLLSQYMLTSGIGLSTTFITVVFTLIPVIITGGIHLDGLLDTADALSSYQSRERKLEILKDPNAGAFAVIIGCVYFLSIFGIYSMIDIQSVIMIGFGFIVSRTLSGLAIVTFPLAKGTGLAATFSNAANKRKVQVVMGGYLIILVLLTVVIGRWLGILMIGTAILVFGYYYRMAKIQFGGITGDLAGYFLQICELVMALVAVIGGKLL